MPNRTIALKMEVFERLVAFRAYRTYAKARVLTMNECVKELLDCFVFAQRETGGPQEMNDEQGLKHVVFKRKLLRLIADSGLTMPEAEDCIAEVMNARYAAGVMAALQQRQVMIPAPATKEALKK